GGDLRSPAHWVWRAAFRIAAGELKTRGPLQPVLDDPPYEMPEPTRIPVAFALGGGPRRDPGARPGYGQTDGDGPDSETRTEPVEGAWARAARGLQCRWRSLLLADARRLF